jgi:hypothetical protein
MNELDYNVKDFFAKALLLPDDKLIIIRYEITKHNIGKIQLSNSIKILDERTIKALQKVLNFIEDYVTDYYFIDIHDTP